MVVSKMYQTHFSIRRFVGILLPFVLFCLSLFFKFRWKEHNVCHLNLLPFQWYKNVFMVAHKSLESMPTTHRQNQMKWNETKVNWMLSLFIYRNALILFELRKNWTANESILQNAIVNAIRLFVSFWLLWLLLQLCGVGWRWLWSRAKCTTYDQMTGTCSSLDILSGYVNPGANRIEISWKIFFKSGIVTKWLRALHIKFVHFIRFFVYLS